MALSNEAVVVLEHCRVSPPPSAVADMTLPLTFFDVPGMHFPHMPCLLFYEFPHSKDYFIQTLVPKFKHTLSLTLKHFSPLSGNLILFPYASDSKPEIRYVDGDSVLLTFAECTKDFNYLASKIPRNADAFLGLTPQIPSGTNSTHSMVLPLLALQVTLFSNYGICIGISNHHGVGDASTIAAFLRAWAKITKDGSDEPLLAGGSLPFYDRTVIKDSKGLYKIWWSQFEKSNKPKEFPTPYYQVPTTSNMVRASFVMGRANIQRLKELLSAQCTMLANVSSFVVVCSYVWSCLAKLHVASAEEMHEDEFEHFICAADCRSRLDPPIPATYFGNCFAPCIATAKTIQLVGEEGLLIGAKAIKQAISYIVNNEEGVLKDAEKWQLDIESKIQQRMFAVIGSPKFSMSDIDFGLGIPKQFEVGFLDEPGRMSLNACKDLEGGLELGLSFSSDKMDAFASIFAEGLKIK